MVIESDAYGTHLCMPESCQQPSSIDDLAAPTHPLHLRSFS
jgi:hypothetical protein